jgi:hypothetical protein
MTKQTLLATLLAASILSAPLLADVRVRINLGVGHPLVRPGRSVIIRPIRRPFVPPTRFVYAPVVRYQPIVVNRPPADRLVWEDSETIQRREQWVESILGVDARGKALFLDLKGSARVDFAEVRFENGQTQVIDFNEARLSPGLHPLLDFADDRRVDSVRIVARAMTAQATLRLLLQK